MNIKSRNFRFLILIIVYISSPALIKIPFKIQKVQTPSNKKIDKIAEDILFFFKLYSVINIGNPPQNIEAVFDIKNSNYYISDTCQNSLTFYSYKNSETFIKTETDEKPFSYGSTFYGNEVFYFYNENNTQRIVKNMLIFLPELNNKNIKDSKNCLNIGLKFPDYNHNNFQESFLQQLKHKNEIGQYFWTIIFYENDDKLNKDYDGHFLFGDIINEYYKKEYKNDFSFGKIVHTYAGSRKIKKYNKEVILQWGFQFDKIYYKNDDLNNTVNINDLITDFDINLNAIYGSFSYFNKIKADYFSYYFNKNICKESSMRNNLYKFIYCYANNFTKNDLEKFPSINFENKILRYTFILDYIDLFSLTNDKKYYIFNIINFNLLNGRGNDDDEDKKWVLGLPFLKKYQFSFDSDNKLIYFYNKDEEFNGRSKNKENYNNNRSIIDNEKNYVKISKGKFIVFIILFILAFFILSYIIIFLFKKILFKKGFIITRKNRTNELINDFDFSSQDINIINDKNKKLIQECELQIKMNGIY